METRIAVISIIVENNDDVEKMNTLLSEYGGHIVGRMGIPYKDKGVSVISVVIDAPTEVISALSGKIGMLKGITTKTIFSTK